MIFARRTTLWTDVCFLVIRLSSARSSSVNLIIYFATPTVTLSSVCYFPNLGSQTLRVLSSTIVSHLAFAVLVAILVAVALSRWHHHAMRQLVTNNIASIQVVGDSDGDDKEESTVLTLVQQGEGPKLEFKFTLRWNLNKNRAGKEVEIAWLKTHDNTTGKATSIKWMRKLSLRQLAMIDLPALLVHDFVNVGRI